MLTLVSALERNVKLYGNEYAVVDKERNFTWEEHVKRVAKLSGALQNLGLCVGDKFGIIGENSFRYTELLHSGYWEEPYLLLSIIASHLQKSCIY